jgi:hypothetical protein
MAIVHWPARVNGRRQVRFGVGGTGNGIDVRDGGQADANPTLGIKNVENIARMGHLRVNAGGSPKCLGEALTVELYYGCPVAIAADLGFAACNFASDRARRC